MTSSAEGAMAGAAFCMMLYASEVVMAQAVPYGMTGCSYPARRSPAPAGAGRRVCEGRDHHDSGHGGRVYSDWQQHVGHDE